MILTLHDERLTSLESLEQFLAGTAGLDPQVADGTEAQRHAHVLSALQRFRYHSLSRATKGLVIGYLLATSGYSRQHLSRLIARFRDHAPLGQRHAPAHGFTRRYTEGDITALA
ncbi:MAG: integrase, partial [Castellaniella sp.]